MKVSTLILSTLLTVTAYANDLTRSQAKNYATEMKQVCSQFFCSADFDWKIDSMSCSFRKDECQVDVTLNDWNYIPHFRATEIEDEFSKRMSRTRDFNLAKDEYGDVTLEYKKTCKISGMDTIDQVYNKKEGRLSIPLYKQLGECVVGQTRDYFNLIDKLKLESRFGVCSKEVRIEKFEAQLVFSQNGERKFYDEKKEYMALQDYMKREHGLDFADEFPFTMALNEKEYEGSAVCKTAMDEIKNDYHILSFLIESGVSGSDMAIRLTKKSRMMEEDNITFTIKR